MARTTGIEVRHARSCSSRSGARCNCSPSYQANVWSGRDRARIRKTFPTLAAAKSWRAEATVALNRGEMRAPSSISLREAGETWIAGARDGTIRNRSGDRYKPSVIRGYEAAFRQRILPDLGARRLSDIRRSDVQDLADRLLAEGLDPSSIRNVLMPLRVIFRRAVARGEIAVNPCDRLQLPAVRGRRERIASPEEAARLVAAVADRDRALWATALYGGLRRGELMALLWEEVDLAAGVIRVERSWDRTERVVVDTKSRGGRRRVPMAGSLRRHLLEHRLLTGAGEGLVFGRSATLPFDPSSTRVRALKAWRVAGLEPIGLHECRHTFASLMIAAGVNAKALSAYMGHASITITLDRYGHLMPGNENEAAGLLERCSPAPRRLPSGRRDNMTRSPTRNGDTAPRTRPRARDVAAQPLARDDPRLTRPLLTVREVANGLRVPESTFRTWARGYERPGRARPVIGEPVVTSLPVRGREASIPFIGVAEGLVLAAFRRSGVPLQRIRPALRLLAEEIGIEHALASHRLYSDGADVLYDYAEASRDADVAEQLTVVRSGQRVFAEVVEDYLQLISYATDGWPALVRLPAFGRAVVLVDPNRAFGRPLFERGGARVEDVLDRWRAGESFEELSRDFGVPVEEIEDAARAAAARTAA